MGHTIVGSSYHPTLVWSDGTALHYIRFDGTAVVRRFAPSLSADDA